MTNYNIDEFKKILREKLSERRYVHSLNVAEMAKDIAKYNYIDQEKAYVAGLLHDITKEMPEEWQDECLRNHHDDVKIKAPNKIKHSYTAKYYLKDELGIVDEDILDAVYNHTICMSPKDLAKIIYIADKREVGRKLDTSAVELAKRDLDAGFKQVTNEVSKYLELKAHARKN